MVGGFFIPRSFKGDLLHKSVFQAYVRVLILYIPILDAIYPTRAIAVSILLLVSCFELVLSWF